jgi:phosphoribosylformylglycinamidine synthase subunit PurL
LKEWRRSVGIGFKAAGDVVLLVGARKGHLGQSLYLRELHGRDVRDAGPPPSVDLAAERKAGDYVRAGIEQGWITAAHDVSDGGIAVAIAEMALAGNMGAIIDKPQPFGPAASFFAEDQGVYVVTVHDAALVDFLSRADARGVEVAPLGRTIGTRLIFELASQDCVVTLAELRAAHEGFFPKLMGAEAALV